MAEAIKDVSNRNDIVLDCFSGSGTTIIAAAKTGRRARVIELDPHYVDVAITRWQDWSGQEAKHAATGVSFAELRDQRAGPPDPPDRQSEPMIADAIPSPMSPVRTRRRMPVAVSA